MNARRVQTVLWIAAVATVAAGIGMTAASYRQRDAAALKLKRKAGDLRELQALQATADYRRQVVGFLETAASGHPRPIGDLARAVLTNETVEIRESEAAGVLPGWSVKRTEASFPGADLARVAEFLAAAEMQRPPWRLVEISVRAARGADNRAQVRVIMESLDRTR